MGSIYAQSNWAPNSPVRPDSCLMGLDKLSCMYPVRCYGILSLESVSSIKSVVLWQQLFPGSPLHRTTHTSTDMDDIVLPPGHEMNTLDEELVQATQLLIDKIELNGQTDPSTPVAILVEFDHLKGSRYLDSSSAHFSPLYRRL